MKHQLLKRVSVIHAIKCNNSLDSNEANQSFLKLQEVITNINTTNEGEIASVLAEIELWKNSKPIVTETEINKLLK